MKRFSGAIVALAVLVVIGIVWGTYVVLNQPPPEVDQTPQVFAFEKDDLRGIKLQRPDGVIEFKQLPDGSWDWVGSDWRPSDSMVRRVGHQTHDLMARATVADPGDLSQYGFSDQSITVTLALGEGKDLSFQAGDPNPTSVSWYVRPLPGDTVYVVKKSAVDYWRMDVEDFREKRFAAFEAEEAVAIDATVDGRTLGFRRVNARQWQQTAPITQRADRQRVRTMLGRTSALKAQAFVEDAPTDLAQYGLAEPAHVIRLTLESGEIITLHVGDILPGTTPQERYVLRTEDNAVYRARDGFIEAFVEDLEDYRDTHILHIEAEDLTHYVVHSDRYEPVTIRRTPDGWRWPDDASIGGATPRRVAREASDPTALAFIDEPEDGVDYGLADATTWVELHVDGQPPITVRAGSTYTVNDPETGRDMPRQYLQVDGDPVIYVTGGGLGEEVDNLLNEYRRKLETDDEKGLLDGSDTDVAPAP